MNIAPHPVNITDDLATPPATAPASDATFYLPLIGTPAISGTLAITLTTEDRSRDEALELINRRYAWRGYGSNHKLSGQQDETTFTANFDGVLIGTITLAADSGRGLGVDATFPEEMQFFRRKQNTRLCELKKLAVECGSSSKPVLASLFNFVFLYGTNNYMGTDLLIEVNPRHVAFYKKMLGFQRVGPIRTNISVNAPSQLMWIGVKEIERAINNGHDDSRNNTLYKYFYSRQVEDNIVNQLNERGLRENGTQAYF